MYLILRANEEVEKTEVKEDVESKETEDQPVVDGASGSSWWGIPTGGYSSWMNKAVSSVTVATELAKQKVRTSSILPGYQY